MRIAKLPRGVEIHFPDGTSDADMDKSVAEFVNSKEPENGGIAKLATEFFAKVQTQIETLKQAIYQMPKLLIEQQFNLKKIEDSFQFIEAYLLSLVQYHKKKEKTNEEIKSGINSIVKAVAGNAPDKHVVEIRRQMELMGESIADAIILSQSRMRSEMAKALSQQAQTSLRMHENSMMAVEKKIGGMTKRIIETLNAPKEIIFDKDKRPVGVKIKDA